MRTQFAYELCVMHDEEKAERVRKAFEKVAEKYPYEVEIEYERGLMKLVEKEKHKKTERTLDFN